MEIEIKNFSLEDTLYSGQVFRFSKIGENKFSLYSGFYHAELEQIGDIINIETEAPKEVWEEYFDINRDYDIINQKLHIKNNLRILKQDKWETLFSFIISQNNNIPRIKLIIERLCNGGTFPSARELYGKDLSYLKAGFRDKYLYDAIKTCTMDPDFLNDTAKLPTDEAREKLKSIRGVGDKVADCVLLFAFSRLEVFPKDVWIKKIFLEKFKTSPLEIDKFVQKNYGEYAGIAQQYLFHFYRNIFNKSTQKTQGDANDNRTLENDLLQMRAM